MQTTITERIKMLIEKENLSVNSFCKKIEVTQSTIDSMLKKGTDPSYKTLSAILNAFPLISTEWLMLGEGYMYKTDSTQNLSTANGNNGNAVTGNNISNVNQVQKKGFSARLVAALIRGCESKEEENKLLDELDGLLDNN